MRHRQFIALARVSSREQEREGFSLDIQEDAITQYAARRNGTIIKLWRIAETASKRAERKTFRELIAFAKKHADEIDGILFYKIDRAARNLFDYVELERLESECEVPFFSVTQPTENSPSGRMQRRVLASMASYYTEQQSLDVREGIQRRVESGLFPQKAPFGYRNVRVAKRGLIEEHPANAAKVRRIFALFAYEQLTLNELQNRLYDEGVFYTDSRPRFPTTVLYAILRNRSYLGELRYHGEWHPGTHAPLVDRVTWDRVKNFMGERIYLAHDLTFASSLIHCQHCGHLITGEMVVKKKTGKAYFYYRCTLYNTPGHPRVRFTEQRLDQQFLEFLSGLRVPHEAQRAWVVRQVSSQVGDRQATMRQQAGEIARQRSLVVHLQDELLSMRLTGEINAEAYAIKLAESQRRAAHLQAKADEFQVAQRSSSDYGDFYLATRLIGTWSVADRAVKRRILQTISSGIALDDAGVSPMLVKPFDVLAGESSVVAVADVDGQQPVVPHGAPPWITQDDLAEAIRVWQPSYGQPLTADDALAIIMNTRSLLEALVSSG